MPEAWIVNHYAVMPDEPGGIRHYMLAAGLARNGWSSTVIAASVSHWSGVQRLTGLRARWIRKDGPIRFLFLRTPTYSGNSLGRYLNMLTFAIVLLVPWAVRGLPRPAVVIGSTIHPLAAFAAWRLAKRHKVPFVFEIRDLWPRTLIDMGRIGERSIAARVLFWMERKLCNEAGAVIVLFKDATRYVAGLGVPEERIHWLPNGTELPAHRPIPMEPRPFTLMYIGAHGEANALEVVLNALTVLRSMEPPLSIHCRFIGEGPARPALIEMAGRLGLDNVSFEAAVPRRQIHTLAAEADALVASLRNLPRLYQYGIGLNKLYDYLAAGRPTILAGTAPNTPVAESGGGLVVEPENPQAMAEAIAAVARMPIAERRAMGEKGRRFVETHHAYAALGDRLAGILNTVVGATHT